MEQEDILDLAERIQSRGRLKIDLLINNTNLADKTTPEMVERGEQTVLRCAESMKISQVYTTGEKAVLDRCRLQTPAMAIERYMVPEWMEDQE